MADFLSCELSQIPKPDVAEWKTIFHQTFNRHGKKYIGVRVALLRESKESAKVSVQIGRYHDDFKGSKLFVSLNLDETAWLMSVMPALVAQLMTTKEEDLKNILFETSSEAGRKVVATGSLFRGTKYAVFTKSIGTESMVVRSVEIPRTTLESIALVLPECLALVKLNIEFDSQMKYIEDILRTILFQIYEDQLKKIDVNDIVDDQEIDILLEKKKQTGLAIQTIVALEKIKADFAVHKQTIDDVMASLGLELLNKAYTFDHLAVLDNIVTNFTLPNTIVTKLVVRFYNDVKNQ